MEIIKATRVGQLLGELEEASRSDRQRQIAVWIAALKSADDATRSKPGARRRLYQANYRVHDVDSEAKGKVGSRRDALYSILRSLAPLERHAGTSTWVFQLYIEDATTIANLIAAPLDAKVDLLSVGELTANRTVLGHAKLKS